MFRDKVYVPRWSRRQAVGMDDEYIVREYLTDMVCVYVFETCHIC